MRLIRSQSDDRIDASRTPRGQVCGEGGDDHEHGDRECHASRVTVLDAEEERANAAADEQRAGNARDKLRATRPTRLP